MPKTARVLWLLGLWATVFTLSKADAQQPALMAIPTLDSVRVKIVDPSAYARGSGLDYKISHWPDRKRPAGTRSSSEATSGS